MENVTECNSKSSEIRNERTIRALQSIVSVFLPDILLWNSICCHYSNTSENTKLPITYHKTVSITVGEKYLYSSLR